MEVHNWRILANATEPSMFGGYAKTAEQIEMPFGVWTRVSQRRMY